MSVTIVYYYGDLFIYIFIFRIDIINNIQFKTMKLRAYTVYV